MLTEDEWEFYDYKLIFNYGFLDQFEPDLKCKRFDNDEEQMVYFGFYYKNIKIGARITYEAINSSDLQLIGASVEREIAFGIKQACIWKEINLEVNKLQSDSPGLRKGQVLFSAVSTLYPDIANKLTATKYDCFNDDSKIESFKKEVTNLLNIKV